MYMIMCKYLSYRYYHSHIYKLRTFSNKNNKIILFLNVFTYFYFFNIIIKIDFLSILHNTNISLNHKNAVLIKILTIKYVPHNYIQ